MDHGGPCQCRYVLIHFCRMHSSNRPSPDVADVDHDPVKAARDARKARVAKNEKQHQQNLARAMPLPVGTSSTGAPADRKKQIDRTLAVTRTSTASMGKFDRRLEGEKKLKGVKRKVSLASATWY